MASKPIIRLVRELVVAMMNSTLYCAGHPRLLEAAERVVDSLRRMFLKSDTVVLGMIKDYLVAEGKPLFDVGAVAARLVKYVREKKGHGLIFTRDVTAEEIISFFKRLMNKKLVPADAADMNRILREAGIVHIRLEETPLADKALAEEIERGVPIKEGARQENFGVPVHIYEESLNILRDMTEKLKRGKIPDLRQADHLLKEIVERIYEDKEPVLSLAAVKDYDAYTYNHSVNVCILVAAVASEAVEESQILFQIGQAGLFHDIGKILVPDEILNKPGKLTEEEWEVMREHPVSGAKILLQAKEISPLAPTVAYTHHLRYDRKGYPRTRRRIEENYIVEAANLIDVYEALTADRPYKKRMAPEKAVEILVEGAGTQFSKKILVDFLRVIGIHPVGATVELDTGEVAIVSKTNPKYLSHPVVKIIRRKNGEEVNPPELVDLSERYPDGSFIRSVKSTIDFSNRYEF